MAGTAPPRTRLLRAAADPLWHAALAAAVVTPLVLAGGRRPLVVAVAAGTLIDVDHALAARSLRVDAWLSLDRRPPSHNVWAAVLAGGVAGRAGGAYTGWAAFGGLASHLLRDAADGSRTPILWPLHPTEHISHRAYAAGVLALLAGSGLVAHGRGTRRAAALATPAAKPARDSPRRARRR